MRNQAGALPDHMLYAHLAGIVFQAEIGHVIDQAVIPAELAFLDQHAREAGREVPVLPVEVLGALADHDWPGNVRELENEMRRLAVLSDGVVRLEQLSERVLASSSTPRGAAPVALDVGGDLRAAVASFEARAIAEALEAAAGNKSRAAEALGISRFALQRKMEKYGVELESRSGTAPEDAAGS